MEPVWCVGSHGPAQRRGRRRRWSVTAARPLGAPYLAMTNSTQLTPR